MAQFGQNNWGNQFGTNNLFPPNQPSAPQQPQQSGFSSLRPAPQVPMTFGKMVNSPDEIVANDVPMDGSIALFLQKDLSVIYAKAWNSNGTIDTVRFIPEKISQPQSQQDPGMGEFQQEVFRRFDKLEKAMTRKSYYGKPRSNGPKKEDA